MKIDIISGYFKKIIETDCYSLTIYGVDEECNTYEIVIPQASLTLDHKVDQKYEIEIKAQPRLVRDEKEIYFTITEL